MDRSVTVVGAGVAGLAAACALIEAGCAVTLLERRPFVGGRASSYEHPALQEVVDCQHVLLGCCTNLLDLYRRVGALSKIRWYEEFNFLEPNGGQTRFVPNGLSAPLHFSDSFLGARMFGLADKLAIARGMREFLSAKEPSDEISMAEWIERTRQTPLAIKHFWEPVILCTLNDSFANCSLRISAKVLRELFLKTKEGSRFGIPTIPLSELYGQAADAIQAAEGSIHLRESVTAITRGADERWNVRATNADFVSDAVVLALPFEQAQPLLRTLPVTEAGSELNSRIEHFVHAPYTTVHLWFDREITDLDYAALLDTTIQWIFHKSRIRGWRPEKGSYLELVIAGSHTHLKMERTQIVASALEELALFFPEVKKARIIKSGVLKEARATFSVIPGLEKLRPPAKSPWQGIYLAGDWVATGWPATMESAARSGYLAAEAFLQDGGEKRSFLVPDLAAAGLMRLFG